MSSRIGKLLGIVSRSGEDEADTDASLVEAIRRGDEQAWSRFLSRHTDLIYTKAWEYSQTAYTARNVDDREDEAMELYAFMVGYVRRSLSSYKGYCQPRTWVHSIVANRGRVLKNYLLHKNPERAEIRLPKIMENRSVTDQEVFKRLVWGVEPAHIAQDLNLPEGHCREIEFLLEKHAKRVYERILVNRTARKPELRIDALLEDAGDVQLPSLAMADPAPNPELELELKEDEQTAKMQISVFEETLDTAANVLTAVERRILILLYNEECSAAEIVELASSSKGLELSEVNDINRVYYLKDRALGRILDLVIERLKEVNDRREIIPRGRKRDLLHALEAVIRERGFPVKSS